MKFAVGFTVLLIMSATAAILWPDTVPLSGLMLAAAMGIGVVLGGA